MTKLRRSFPPLPHFSTMRFLVRLPTTTLDRRFLHDVTFGQPVKFRSFTFFLLLLPLLLFVAHLRVRNFALRLTRIITRIRCSGARRRPDCGFALGRSSHIVTAKIGRINVATASPPVSETSFWVNEDAVTQTSGS